MEVMIARHLLKMVIFLVFVISGSVGAELEPGIFEENIIANKNMATYRGYSKNMYNKTNVHLNVLSCQGSSITITWMIRFSECEGGFQNSEGNDSAQASVSLGYLFDNPVSLFEGETYRWYYKSKPQLLFCDCLAPLENNMYDDWIRVEVATDPVENQPKKGKENETKDRVKRCAGGTSEEEMPHIVTRTRFDGRYLFIVKIEPGADWEVDVKLKVDMKSLRGYLSAFQWPLLPFYGFMCGSYSLLLFVWLFGVCFKSKIFKKIHIWICGTIVLGLSEKALFYAEFYLVNKYGTPVAGLIIFAELMSCLKRALSRILLIIVSMGYDITRPEINKKTKLKLIAVGTLYFILSAVEDCLRIKGNEQHALIVVLPLVVLDAVICWWIFKSLRDTRKQLKLHRNLTKYRLYRHLTNALIVCIVCAVVFLVWSTKAHRWTTCVTQWRWLWLDDAFWHVLFCIYLVVIMVLAWPLAEQPYALMDIDLDPVKSMDEMHAESVSEKQHPMSEGKILHGYETITAVSKKQHPMSEGKILNGDEIVTVESESSIQ